MRSIQAEVHSEMTLKKSIFTGFVAPIHDEDGAKAWLRAIKKRFPNAHHVCYAYVLNDGMTVRFDDDGEPARTAGFPIAEVLRKHDLTDVVAAVVRDYGGVKLGASGLVRAYTKSVSEALEGAVKVEKQTLLALSCTLSYPLHARLEAFLNEQFTVVKTHFDTHVTVSLHCLERDYDRLVQDFHDKAQAPIDLTITHRETVYR